MHVWLARQCTHTQSDQNVNLQPFLASALFELTVWHISISCPILPVAAFEDVLIGGTKDHIRTNYHNLSSSDYRNHANFLLNPNIPWRKRFSSFLINCNPWHAFLEGTVHGKKTGTSQHCAWLLCPSTCGRICLRIINVLFWAIIKPATHTTAA